MIASIRASINTAFTSSIKKQIYSLQPIHVLIFFGSSSCRNSTEGGAPSKANWNSTPDGSAVRPRLIPVSSMAQQQRFMSKLEQTKQYQH